MNLSANAEYAMRPVGGVLEIRADRVELDDVFAVPSFELDPGPYVALAIRDTGAGMPSHMIERIFDPFFTTKGVGEGTGMGLAIVHGIATGYGGGHCGGEYTWGRKLFHYLFASHGLGSRKKPACPRTR
ncbi:MAG: hypothetical protein ETSY1_35410 [Candidatus Entotheonella factor]|uniref:histidine kinase n=1 Tax=Entotheonella factor TaxID=1429438 RepID=W4L8X2_ENTF1|nr:MAG: hypothetical protein ETSY1_35410 [Candidatus Entotheonella factor]